MHEELAHLYSIANMLPFCNLTAETILPKAVALHPLAEGHDITPMDTQSISDDEEWDPPTEFAAIYACQSS